MMTVTKETWSGPMVAVYPDGRRFTTERDVTIIDDWRDTVLGCMNFGQTILGPVRTVEIFPSASQHDPK